MGFDTSYHPVDTGLLASRVVPFVLGAGADDALDDLIVRGMEIRRIRWRAKAWALAARAVMTGDDPFRYVWGRPFFITSARAATVAQDVVSYLRITHRDEVTVKAREMVAGLAPDADLAPTDPAAYPGTEEALREEVGGPLLTLRRAVAALRAGAPLVPGTRRDFAPDSYVAANAVFDLVEFGASLVPGWMDRGRWPTALAETIGGELPGLTTPQPLVAALVAEFPALDWKFRRSIVANYSVGGFVPAAAVPAAREWFALHRERILTADPDAELTLDKIDESMGLASRLGHGFCEATEIYSGLGGTMN